jgi:hypothetical protein
VGWNRLRKKGVGREYSPDWDSGSIGGRSGRSTRERGEGGRGRGEPRSLAPEGTVRSSPIPEAGSLKDRTSQGTVERRTTRSPTTIEPGLSGRC